MNQKNIFVILIAIFSLSSCVTKKPLSSNVKPIEVVDLQLFEPLSYVSFIETGNKAALNDSLSLESKQLVIKTINTFRGKLPVTGELFVADSVVNRKLAKEIEFLCVVADRQKKISNLKVTPTIDSLLRSKGKRFGLLTVLSGFTRTKQNYSKQIIKGAAVSVLTLGMVYLEPVKANSTIYTMIIDVELNNIAFFKKVSRQDKDPLDGNILRKQITEAFNGYFWNEKVRY